MSRWALFVVVMVASAFPGALLVEALGPHLGILAASPLFLAVGLTMEWAIDGRKQRHRSQ